MNDDMAENGLLLRNLNDAGCCPDTIKKFLRFRREGKIREQLGLLSGQRTSLLNKVHESQKMVDCLDFLVFDIKQKNESLNPGLKKRKSKGKQR